jgi:RNA polymerase sigma factor (sigma-70 family)
LDNVMTVVNDFDAPYAAADGFSAAIAAYQRQLAGFAFLLCGDRTVAEDLVAEAYARVWPKYREQNIDDLGPYLRQVVANLATGRLRRLRLERRETEKRTLDWRFAESQRNQNFESAVDDHSQLWPAIWALPADQRAVIVLRLVEDLSERECASMLGIRPGTVKSRLARGLSTLRSTLGEDVL